LSTADPMPEITAITDRVRARVRTMARAMAADEHEDISRMPSEIRELEVPQTARTIYQVNLDALAEGRMLSDGELAEARRRGAQRAREDFPVDLLVHNWSRGAAVLWQGCVEETRQDERAGLVEIATRLFALLEQQMCALVESYHATRTAIDRHETGAAPMVARLLISGQDSGPHAQRAGIHLAASYDVVAVRLATTDDERSDQPAVRSVAGRRKVQRVVAALDRHGPSGILAAVEPEGGHVLLPREPVDRHAAGRVDADACRALLAVIEQAAGAATTAAAWFAEGLDDVPAAARQAAEMARVAERAGLGPGLHGLESDPLGYLLSRPGAAHDELVRVLDPLDPHPELVATIRTLLARDGDRGRTARALGVHPNTINNRLARARDLLGFDPMSTHGIVLLSTALTARRLGPDEEDPA
jgi:hypothetical protein